MGRYLLVRLDCILFQCPFNAEWIISFTFPEAHEERSADTLELTPM